MSSSSKSKVVQKQQKHKSLSSFLHFFEGTEIIVEQKTGRQYRGVLASADEYMNLLLHDAERLQQRNPPEVATVLHLRGPSIRYIHFPDDADLAGLIRAGQERAIAAANKYRRGIRK